MSTCDLIQIPYLHIEVRALLGLRLGYAAHIPHFGEGREVLVVVRFVNKQPVDAQFFKGHNVVLARLIVQLIQLGLHLLLCTFQLLDGKTISPILLHLRDAGQDLLPLLFQVIHLPPEGQWDLLQLAVPDNNSVILSGSDPSTKPFPVLGFKVLCGRHKDIRRRIELQILRGPLLGEVVRHHDQALLAETQAFALLGDGYHGERLPCAHHVSQQFISSVQPAGYGVELMRPKADLRIHTGQGQMAAVVLTGANGIEFLVIELTEAFPAALVLPDPLLERLLDLLLLGLGDGGLLLIQDRLTISILIFNIVKDADILQVKGLLHDLIAVDTLSTVGVMSLDAAPVIGLPLNVPFSGVL